MKWKYAMDLLQQVPTKLKEQLRWATLIQVCFEQLMWHMKDDSTMKKQVFFQAPLLGSSWNEEMEKRFAYYSSHISWPTGSGVACLCCSVVTLLV